MHKCELTNEQLQAAVAFERELAQRLGGTGPETRRHTARLADALQELIDRRVDAESEERRIERSFAYEAASGYLETSCSHPDDSKDEGEYLEVWLDLASLDFPDEQACAEEALDYLIGRGLVDRHPDCPTWIHVRDEDEPRAAGPLDPAPEVRRA
jgi:hypothetical protein